MKSYILSLAAITALALAGCNQPDKAHMTDAQLGLNPQQANGRRIFSMTCAGCHDAYGNSSKGGPSLKGLFRKKELPSGTPANDIRVREVIVTGRAVMPGFGRSLTDQQVNDLLAYLHTL